MYGVRDLELVTVAANMASPHGALISHTPPVEPKPSSASAVSSRRRRRRIYQCVLGLSMWTSLLVAGPLIGVFIANQCADTVAFEEAMLVVIGHGTPSFNDIDVGELLSTGPLEFV